VRALLRADDAERLPFEDREALRRPDPHLPAVREDAVHLPCREPLLGPEVLETLDERERKPGRRRGFALRAVRDPAGASAVAQIRTTAADVFVISEPLEVSIRSLSWILFIVFRDPCARPSGSRPSRSPQASRLARRAGTERDVETPRRWGVSKRPVSSNGPFSSRRRAGRRSV